MMNFGLNANYQTKPTELSCESTGKKGKGKAWILDIALLTGG